VESSRGEEVKQGKEREREREREREHLDGVVVGGRDEGVGKGARGRARGRPWRFMTGVKQ